MNRKNPFVKIVIARALCVICLAGLGLSLNLKAQEDPNYKISPNDVLDLRRFQEPDLDAQVRVAGDGTAIFPLIGSVRLAGKSVSEAIALLRQRYQNGYLVNPQISLIVQNYAKVTFTILGQVQRPGAYDIVGDQQINLLEAVGMAGGYTRIADPGNITIHRKENGQDVVIRINGKHPNKAGLGSTNFVVRGGDIVNVGESIF